MILRLIEKLNNSSLLVLGIVFIVAAHVSYSIDLFAWFSSVPFLLYLHRTSGLKSRLFMALALFVAWTLATAKIITPPIPYAMVFLFSLPLTLIHLPAYLIWSRFRDRPYSMWLFPLIFTIMEWIQYTFMPFASWGVAANTQSHDLPMLQILSLFGMGGLSFLIYWVNIGLSVCIIKKELGWNTAILPAAAVLMVLSYGSLRMDFWKASAQETVMVAAVGTDSEISSPPFADEKTNQGYQQALLDRTTQAAQSGAQLVCWNEAAIFIPSEGEAAWKTAICELAAKQHISLVAAYVIPVSSDPLQLENKLLSINSNGEIVYQYLKHQPVPGEPSIKGDEPFRIMSDKGLKIGAAICYDFDYPRIGTAFGKLGAQVVAVPSSDWRGIDPLHTKMAGFRAIEQGYSILRSTRFGLSAAINPLGEMTTQQSSFDVNSKVMIATLPVARFSTLYALIGDLFVYTCIGALLLLAFLIGRHQKE